MLLCFSRSLTSMWVILSPNSCVCLASIFIFLVSISFNCCSPLFAYGINQCYCSSNLWPLELCELSCSFAVSVKVIISLKACCCSNHTKFGWAVAMSLSTTLKSLCSAGRFLCFFGLFKICCSWDAEPRYQNIWGLANPEFMSLFWSSSTINCRAAALNPCCGVGGDKLIPWCPSLLSHGELPLQGLISALTLPSDRPDANQLLCALPCVMCCSKHSIKSRKYWFYY